MENFRTHLARQLAAVFICCMLFAGLYFLHVFVIGLWNPDDWGIFGRFVFTLLGLVLFFAVLDASRADDDGEE